MEPISSTKMKKNKTKKIKSCENLDKQNINMKKSFSKFDDLQKRSLIHVRSRDSNKAKEIFRTPADQQLDNCHQCQKPVYKMEEVILQLKTGTKIFHKTCLRCKDCSKQLKPESYHAHDGNLYCHMHFKLIFAPKIVYEEVKPRKPELIIRENQPMELPPDVARASDKPNLGLDELQQLNVRSRFEVFENGGCKQNNNHSQEHREETTISNGKSIRSTLTKLHKLGISNSKSDQLNEMNNMEESDDNSNDSNDDSDDYSRMILMEKERPLGLGEAINDIRSKFENGEMITKEERREERKQEIQGIRSRLFMGKQAKIKEMYQQAVAESEHGITSVGKNKDFELTTATRSIKDRFENGEAFKDSTKIQSREAMEDVEVFESAISRASRNIFMELDANIASDLVSSRSSMPNNRTDKLIQSNQTNADIDIIKSDSKTEDIKVATEELSERFKFFEQFRPVENKKRTFRITPPREGVVVLDTDTDISLLTNQTSAEDNILQKTKTASTILSKFREMEKYKMSDENEKKKQPNPLKCFTPPPETEINKHFNINKSDSEEGESISDDEETNSNEGSDDDEEMEDENVVSKSCNKDQALQEAKNAARAKQLRAKFEKWQINEIQRELKEDREDVYSQLISSDSIESAKTIRERFENMKKIGQTEVDNNSPRAQINRFV